MNIFGLACSYGITIQFADLGDWGRAELRSEYDPTGPTIWVNTRAIRKCKRSEMAAFIGFAVAHEIYHHQEHRHHFARFRDRAQRERAADDYALQLLFATQ